MEKIFDYDEQLIVALLNNSFIDGQIFVNTPGLHPYENPQCVGEKNKATLDQIKNAMYPLSAIKGIEDEIGYRPTGYSLPAKPEDFNYALKQAAWEVWEAFCWLHGETSMFYRGDIKQDYREQVDLVMREIETGELTPKGSSPCEWIKWAISTGCFPVPEQLRLFVETGVTHRPLMQGLQVTNMSESFHVFLSHNSQDKLIARMLAQALKLYDLRVWLDEEQLVPGRIWQENLETIIQTTQAAAVLIGESGLGPWEDPEMRACLSEFVQRKLSVIPVLLPGTPYEPELPLFLRSFTWVDLRDGLTDPGLRKLVWGITGVKPVKPAN